MFDNYHDDPEPSEETDEYLDEIFATHHFMGAKPEDLAPEYRAKYEAWLKAQA